MSTEASSSLQRTQVRLLTLKKKKNSQCYSKRIKQHKTNVLINCDCGMETYLPFCHKALCANLQAQDNTERWTGRQIAVTLYRRVYSPIFKMLTDSPKLVSLSVCVCTCSGRGSIVKALTRTATEVRYNRLSPRHHVKLPVIRTCRRTHVGITLSLATVFRSGRSICFDQYVESDLRPVRCLLLNKQGGLVAVNGGPSTAFSSAAVLIS